MAGAAVVAAMLAGPSQGGNVETVGALYTAFGAGDIPTILAMLAEDVAWDHGYEGTAIATLVPRTGRDEVRGFFDALGGFEFLKFQILNMLEGGDQVAVVIDVDLVGKVTGLGFSDREVHVWTFDDDGRVVAFRHFLDMEEYARILPD